MRVEIAKRADGVGVLRCIRADGSVTWQKQPRHGAHFALHDLTHFAVETTLGFSQAFFGLIRDGWEIEDTSGKGARGPLPPEALEAEAIVGMLDCERASGKVWSLEERHEFGPPAALRLTDGELALLRARRSELFARWADVPAGSVLELEF